MLQNYFRASLFQVVLWRTNLWFDFSAGAYLGASVVTNFKEECCELK